MYNLRTSRLGSESVNRTLVRNFWLYHFPTHVVKAAVLGGRLRLYWGTFTFLTAVIRFIRGLCGRPILAEFAVVEPQSLIRITA